MIKILSPSDSGKIQDGHGDVLAEAWVYHDILMPGYFVTGDFASWKLANANRMDAGNDDNYAILEDFDISTAGGMKIVHLKDDGTTAWHGANGTSDSNNISVEAANYNIYVSKKSETDGYVYVLANALYNQIGLVGTTGGWDNDVYFTLNGHVATLSNVVLATDAEFKIRADHSWDVSWGYANVTLTCEEGVYDAFENKDGNFKVVWGGTFNFTFNYVTRQLTVSGTLNDNDKSYFLVGGFSEWNKLEENKMTRIGVNIYKLEHVVMGETDSSREVKVRDNNEGWFSPDGNNFKVGDSAGTYTVFFNSSNNNIWYTLEA